MQLLCYVQYKPPDPNLAVIISTRCLIYSDIYSELKALAETLHYYFVTEVCDGSTHDVYLAFMPCLHVVGLAFLKVWILYLYYYTCIKDDLSLFHTKVNC